MKIVNKVFVSTVLGLTATIGITSININDDNSILIPTTTKSTQEYQIKQVVSAGDNSQQSGSGTSKHNYGGTTMAIVHSNISDTDKLYGWGFNKYGQLGTGKATNPITTPAEIKLGSNTKTIKTVELGTRVGAAATIDNSGKEHLYTWGDNKGGALGINKDDSLIYAPTEVKFIDPIDNSLGIDTINEITIGSESKVISSKDTLNDTGIGASDVDAFRGDNVSDSIHILVSLTNSTTGNDYLYGWGNNTYGAVNHLDPTQPAQYNGISDFYYLKPTWILDTDKETTINGDNNYQNWDIKQITSGSNSSGVVLTNHDNPARDEDHLVMWGINNNGQLAYRTHHEEGGYPHWHDEYIGQGSENLNYAHDYTFDSAYIVKDFEMSGENAAAIVVDTDGNDILYTWGFNAFFSQTQIGHSGPAGDREDSKDVYEDNMNYLYEKEGYGALGQIYDSGNNTVYDVDDVMDHETHQPDHNKGGYVLHNGKAPHRTVVLFSNYQPKQISINDIEMFDKGSIVSTTTKSDNKDHIYAWGWNEDDRFGTGNTEYLFDKITLPKDITSTFLKNPGDKVKDIAVGVDNAAVIVTDANGQDHLLMTGVDDYGQRGDGNNPTRPGTSSELVLEPTIKSSSVENITQSTADVEYQISASSNYEVRNIKIVDDNGGIYASKNTTENIGEIDITGTGNGINSYLTPETQYSNLSIQLDYYGYGIVKEPIDSFTTLALEDPIAPTINSAKVSDDFTKINYDITIPATGTNVPTTIDKIEVVDQFQNSYGELLNVTENVGSIDLNDMIPDQEYNNLYLNIIYNGDKNVYEKIETFTVPGIVIPPDPVIPDSKNKAAIIASSVVGAILLLILIALIILYVIYHNKNNKKNIYKVK